MRNVVITGLGSVSSAGLGAESLWQSLKLATSSIGPIRRFDVEKYRTRIAGEVSLDSTVVTGLGIAHQSRNAQFAVAAASEALEHSAMLRHDVNRKRIGICLGSGLGGMYFSEESIGALRECGPRGVSPMTVPFVDPNSIVAQIAIRWGLRGRQLTVSTACSSSAHALGTGMEMIRNGHCDAVLAGGVEATISPLIFAGFDRLRAMSSRNDTPDVACRPFSSDRDGFVMAEGAAMLMLEDEAHAIARGAHIYAVLAGYAATGGAHHAVMPRPDGGDLVDSIALALDGVGIAPNQIDLINPHGTGTKLNDEAELCALQTVFGTRLADIAMSPTKQLTGHMLGAAGALESLHIVRSIDESCITPIKYHCGDQLGITTGPAYQSTIRYALNNSFGFGNNNVSLIFGAYQ